MQQSTAKRIKLLLLVCLVSNVLPIDLAEAAKPKEEKHNPIFLARPLVWLFSKWRTQPPQSSPPEEQGDIYEDYPNLIVDSYPNDFERPSFTDYAAKGLVKIIDDLSNSLTKKKIASTVGKVGGIVRQMKDCCNEGNHLEPPCSRFRHSFISNPYHEEDPEETPSESDENPTEYEEPTHKPSKYKRKSSKYTKYRHKTRGTLSKTTVTSLKSGKKRSKSTDKKKTVHFVGSSPNKSTIGIQSLKKWLISLKRPSKQQEKLTDHSNRTEAQSNSQSDANLMMVMLKDADLKKNFFPFLENDNENTGNHRKRNRDIHFVTWEPEAGECEELAEVLRPEKQHTPKQQLRDNSDLCCSSGEEDEEVDVQTLIDRGELSKARRRLAELRQMIEDRINMNNPLTIEPEYQADRRFRQPGNVLMPNSLSDSRYYTTNPQITVPDTEPIIVDHGNGMMSIVPNIHHIVPDNRYVTVNNRPVMANFDGQFVANNGMYIPEQVLDNQSFMPNRFGYPNTGSLTSTDELNYFPDNGPYGIDVPNSIQQDVSYNQAHEDSNTDLYN